MTHFSDGVQVGANFTPNGTASAPGMPMSIVNIYDVVPVALDADGIAEAQAVAAAGNLTINGALAASGAVTLDVPRAVQILSTNAGDTTQVATFFGFDVYGVAMSEAITFNGTTAVPGKKAFSRITRVAISAALTGNASAGSTDVLGMPYRVVNGSYSLRTFNGALVTTGVVASALALSGTSTTTTADVRGTFTPASATTGSARLLVWIFSPNADTRAAIYGVPQA
jgi:hypothetical protein